MRNAEGRNGIGCPPRACRHHRGIDHWRATCSETGPRGSEEGRREKELPPRKPPRPAAYPVRLIEARHTRSLENRLQYAHLDHASDPTSDPTSDPGPDPGSDTPIPGAAASADPDPDPGHGDADPGRGDADTGRGGSDDEASRYETDLVALAALADLAGPTGGPGPAPDALDPGLEAELAGFAGLLTGHRTDPDTTGDTEPDQRDATGDDNAQEAS